MSEKIKKKSITQKKTNRKKNSNKNYDKEFNINKFKEKAFTQIHQMDKQLLINQHRSESF